MNIGAPEKGPVTAAPEISSDGNAIYMRDPHPDDSPSGSALGFVLGYELSVLNRQEKTMNSTMHQPLSDITKHAA